MAAWRRFTNGLFKPPVAPVIMAFALVLGGVVGWRLHAMFVPPPERVNAVQWCDWTKEPEKYGPFPGWDYPRGGVRTLEDLKDLALGIKGTVVANRLVDVTIQIDSALSTERRVSNDVGVEKSLKGESGGDVISVINPGGVCLATKTSFYLFVWGWSAHPTSVRTVVGPDPQRALPLYSLDQYGIFPVRDGRLYFDESYWAVEFFRRYHGMPERQFEEEVQRAFSQ